MLVLHQYSEKISSHTPYIQNPHTLVTEMQVPHYPCLAVLLGARCTSIPFLKSQKAYTGILGQSSSPFDWVLAYCGNLNETLSRTRLTCTGRMADNSTYNPPTQRTPYPSIKEYSLNHSMKPLMI